MLASQPVLILFKNQNANYDGTTAIAISVSCKAEENAKARRNEEEREGNAKLTESRTGTRVRRLSEATGCSFALSELPRY